MAIKTVEMDFEYMNLIFNPPMPNNKLREDAVSNDEVTIQYWEEIWIKKIRDNNEKFGPFQDKSIDKIFDSYKYKPCIIAGAGPSLKKNFHVLKERNGIPLVSCLHNFHLMEDNDIAPEYYVTLDSGEITIKEVTEGGTKSEDEYWERTKERTLLAYIGTSHELIEKWQGEVLFFTTPAPSPKIKELQLEIGYDSCLISTGGNVLGACLYIAKIMGCNPVAFVGADFSFSYTNKFHAWDSPYDKNLGQYLRAIDVYGNAVKTWKSYYNFKSFFEWVSLTVPGIYINCTEGGCLGAYPEGNLNSIRPMDLSYFLEMYQLNDKVKSVFSDITKQNNLILY